MRATNGDNLQAILNETPNGAALLVETGVYEGDLDFSGRDGVKLVGEGNVVIGGDIRVNAGHNIVIRGITLNGGILANGVNGLSIAHNQLSDGIIAENCKRLLVERNRFESPSVFALKATQCGDGLVVSTNQVVDFQGETPFRFSGCVGLIGEHNEVSFADGVKKAYSAVIEKDCEGCSFEVGNSPFPLKDERSPSKRDVTVSVPEATTESINEAAPVSEEITDTGRG